MPLIACGINHKTTPLSIREKLAISEQMTPSLLHHLRNRSSIEEAMLLSTCNRTEIYAQTLNAAPLLNWARTHPALSKLMETNQWYWHEDINAITHMMRVACGLDSMAIGEPQILGQIKKAFEIAKQSGSIGRMLGHLLPQVFATTKQVRTHTQLGAHPISIAYVAVSLAKRIFSDLSKARVLCVGSGQTIQLVALHLVNHGVKDFYFANRSLEKTHYLAEQFQGHQVALSDIPLYLPQVNIVVSATASPLPVFGKGMIESALHLGKRRVILMLDLAVPRDIEPEIAKLEDVYLYNIDHLQTIAQENNQSRALAAKQAETMIDLQARYCLRQMETHNVNAVIRSYREKLEQLCEHEVKKALKNLKNGQDPAHILKKTTRLLINKMLHIPSVQLRHMAFEEQTDMLAAAHKLFDL